MRLVEVIREFHDRFPRNGEFDLRPGESIYHVVRREAVPNEFGAYIIYGTPSCSGEAIYIGKAGTLEQGGSLKKQGLSKRLLMRQGGKRRAEFFREVMDQSAPKGLSFAWFITFDGPRRVLPALAEAQLLQAFFEDRGALPLLNKAF